MIWFSNKLLLSQEYFFSNFIWVWSYIFHKKTPSLWNNLFHLPSASVGAYWKARSSKSNLRLGYWRAFYEFLTSLQNNSSGHILFLNLSRTYGEDNFPFWMLLLRRVACFVFFRIELGFADEYRISCKKSPIFCLVFVRLRNGCILVFNIWFANSFKSWSVINVKIHVTFSTVYACIF